MQSTGGFRGGSGGFRGGFRVVLEGVPRGFRGVPWGSVGFRGGFRGGSVVAPSIELNVFYHVSGDIDGGSAFQKAISAEPPFATCNFLLKLKKGNKFRKRKMNSERGTFNCVRLPRLTQPCAARSG